MFLRPQWNGFSISLLERIPARRKNILSNNSDLCSVCANSEHRLLDSMNTFVCAVLDAKRLLLASINTSIVNVWRNSFVSDTFSAGHVNCMNRALSNVPLLLNTSTYLFNFIGSCLAAQNQARPRLRTRGKCYALSPFLKMG